MDYSSSYPCTAPGFPDTVEARRHHLHGYVTGVFRIGDMMRPPSAPSRAIALGCSLKMRWPPWANASSTATNGGRSARFTRRRGVRCQAALARYLGDGWTPVGPAGRPPTLAYLTEQRTWYAWSIITCGLLFVGLLGAFLLLSSRGVRSAPNSSSQNGPRQTPRWSAKSRSARGWERPPGERSPLSRTLRERQ